MLPKRKFDGQGLGVLGSDAPLEKLGGPLQIDPTGVDEINRLKNWQVLDLVIGGPCPQFEISDQPHLQRLKLHFHGTVGQLRIVNCPRLEPIEIHCTRQSISMPFTVERLHLERLHQLAELDFYYVLPKEVFLQDSVQYMSSCSLREATNATMLHAIATQATALRGLALFLDQQRTSADPLSGDLGLLEDLPRHETLSHFTFRSDFEAANVALKLLADAPDLYTVSIQAVKVPPELIEPLTKARKLQNLIINRQQYVRSFRPADGQPWYSPDRRSIWVGGYASGVRSRRERRGDEGKVTPRSAVLSSWLSPFIVQQPYTQRYLL